MAVAGWTSRPEGRGLPGGELEIVTTDRLGILGQAMRDFGNAVCHGGLGNGEARRWRRASDCKNE